MSHHFLLRDAMQNKSLFYVFSFCLLLFLLFVFPNFLFHHFTTCILFQTSNTDLICELILLITIALKVDNTLNTLQNTHSQSQIVRAELAQKLGFSLWLIYMFTNNRYQIWSSLLVVRRWLLKPEIGCRNQQYEDGCWICHWKMDAGTRNWLLKLVVRVSCVEVIAEGPKFVRSREGDHLSFHRRDCWSSKLVRVDTRVIVEDQSWTCESGRQS